MSRVIQVLVHLLQRKRHAQDFKEG